MTLEQKQCLLRYLGYYTGSIDGVWGGQSQRATIDFQRSYMEQGDVDGIFGAETEKRILEVIATGEKPAVAENATTIPADENKAEKYLQADGCYHIPKGVEVQLTRNFWASEIHCQGVGCCTESVISKRIMDLAQEIRDDIGEPLSIATAGGSGYRCPVHNAETPGASPKSLHTISDALDLHYRDPAKLKAATLRHLRDGEVGLYSWGCHVGRWDRGYVNQFNG